MKNLKKTIRPGMVTINGLDVPVYCTIEYTDGRFSISGVEGPRPSGNCDGDCGQIDGGYAHRNSHDNDRRESNPKHIGSFAPGWTQDMWWDFLDVWKKWHLNDMQAGCEHQRAIDTTKTVEVVTYKLTHDAMRLRDETREDAAHAALDGRPFNPTPTARALALLEDWYNDIHTPPDADSPLSGCYEVAKREEKAIGWVTQREHPEGMLSRKCPTCGYAYGSAWLKVEVPEDVLKFLESLPDADHAPAWV